MKKEYKTPAMQVIQMASTLPVCQSRARMSVFDKDESQSNDDAINNNGYYIGDIY